MAAPNTTGTGQVDLAKRTPRDFKATENSRPDWDHERPFTWTKTREPDWKIGQGANLAPEKKSEIRQIPIDPFEPGRDPAYNYRLITSAVIPRPTAVVSTISQDGEKSNLAPYSFFQAMSHDPPTFVVAHATNASGAKDSLRNLRETGECVLHVLTEEILEASNACAMNTPYGVSEWSLSGLTPAPCKHVRPSRIAEAVFAVECKLVAEHAISSRSQEGKVSNVITILEGVRFWVREDCVDEERKYIDPAKSKPIGRLQGISYGRVTDGFQIPWPDWEEIREGAEAEGRVKGKEDGQ
ncbi:related to conserved domain typically associated with flavo oxygenases, DIM6 NTAB family [Lecanosticta acicola]|uniref:Related to conserved domain typically associated with flavo oxygenases, DIM6 NTAB family n=1 Tax=Lecanosticta acicola TaxID=111012 RepID=A0AAI8Z7D8_9PEZI|nr:related to conserved domain typically associated with flavo oxygenases, DIM6 NTAB family [Lecanosticta acicola]